MNPLVSLIAILLLSVAANAVIRWRRSRRIACLLGGLDADVRARHVDRQGRSRIAIDTAGHVHLAAFDGGQLRQASLPVEQLESVTVIEDGDSGATGRPRRMARSVNLRVALPDDRRSLFDIEFLGRCVKRGSRAHTDAKRASDAWHARASGMVVRPDEDSRLPDGWSMRTRMLHAAAASALIGVLGVSMALETRLDDQGRHVQAVTDRTAAVVAAAASTSQGQARVFERDLARWEKRVAALIASSADDPPDKADAARAADRRLVEHGEASSMIERGRALPLGEDHRKRLDDLTALLDEVRERELPDYRQSFARMAQRGGNPVGAWTRGADHRVLELTRHDLERVEARDLLWDALGEEAQRLGFERVEFRAYRNGRLFDVRPERVAETK